MPKPLHIITMVATLCSHPVAAMAAPNAEQCASLTASGEAELSHGNLTGASKFLQQAVEICNQNQEKSARPYIAYGKLMFERQNLNEAIKWFKRALQDEPDLPLAYMNISAAYFQQGDYDNAVRYGIQAVTSNEKHMTDHDPDEAAKWLAKSAYNVGLAYNALGGEKNDVSYAKKAEPYFLKTVEYMPSYNQTYYQLGIIREVAYQDYKAAAEYYAKSCDMGYPTACNWNDGLKNRVAQYGNASQDSSSSSADAAKSGKTKKKRN